MGIRLNQSEGYDDLLQHVGHTIEIVTYGNPISPQNVAIECVTCYTVLVDFDRPDPAPHGWRVELEVVSTTGEATLDSLELPGTVSEEGIEAAAILAWTQQHPDQVVHSLMLAYYAPIEEDNA